MRGYQKRVIHLKNVGSQSFEEAYFVLRSDAPSGVGSPEMMIDEANRIIEENFGKGKKRAAIGKRGYVLSFFAGSVLTTAIIALIYFIF